MIDGMKYSCPRIVVYAFATSAYFFSEVIKRSRELVEWSIIIPRGHHLDELRGLVPAERLLYLYECFNKDYLRQPDISDFVFPEQGDNFSYSLLKDKDGYRHLDKDEQLRRIAVVYQTYRRFLEEVRPEYVLFPDLEVVDGFVLINLCQELGITPIYHVGMRSLGGSFFAQNAEERLPVYFGTEGVAEMAVAADYVRQVSEAGRVIPLAGAEVVKVAPPRPKNSFVRRVVNNLWLAFTKERYYSGEDNFWLNCLTLVRHQLNALRRLWFKTWQVRFFDLVEKGAVLPQRFVYYALQYTPESSINGLMPYYVDQMRAIDRLLIGLPHGFRLLVKEHPAMMGVRDSAFYRQLRRRPGVVLVAPWVDSAQLIQKASLIASVTGTVGLESFLLDRPCCLFGKTFFSHLCYPAEEWMTRPGWISELLADYQAPSFEEKVREIAKLLAIRFDFELADPFAVPAVLAPDNVERFLSALLRHLQLIKHSQEPAT